MQKSLKGYIPGSKKTWLGRNDGPDALRMHQVIHCVNLLENPELKPHCFALVGFACDEGVRRNGGRVGAKLGPDAFRVAFANLPSHLDSSKVIYDCGTVACEGDNLEEAQDTLASVITLLLKSNILPIVIGGGHELSWSQYRGYADAYPNKACSIVNFDAHYDIRPLQTGKGHSGSSFRQIHTHCKEQQIPFDYSCIGISKYGNTANLHQTAREMKTAVVFAEDLHQKGNIAAAAVMERVKLSSNPIYLSLCLDVFAAADAPGVSAPQSMGLAPWQLIPHMLSLMQTGRVITIGIAELCPTYDLDSRTAKLAAQIVSMLISQPQC